MKEFEYRIRNIFKDHTTQETAISRRHLEIMLMTSDRMARRTIEEARNIGIPIVSSSNGKGYWLNKEDYRDIYLREVKARIRAERQKIDAYYSDDPMQVTIDEVI